MKVLKLIGVVIVFFVLLFFVFSLTVGTTPKEGFMETCLEELERYFTHRKVANDEVSKVDIAWQLDHTLKAINNITASLEESKPEDYKLNFNFSRTLIFTFGDFPRGLAQAPTSVMPPEEITYEALLDQLNTAKEKMVIIQNLPENSSMQHATFGLLDRNEAARLIEVHTDHHLKIIRDILKAEGIPVE